MKINFHRKDLVVVRKSTNRSVKVGSCTRDGEKPCDNAGAACLDLVCGDELATGPSVNPAFSEICAGGIDNNCDELTDCYDVTNCAPDAGCSACIDEDGDRYFAVNALCFGGSILMRISIPGGMSFRMPFTDMLGL
ncbi:MAG: hypothetical protein VR64_21370 [Desulfatitalea sp. BRH_c12]|nr:MAG: hypothetical protein VR64_21370 [Desulfatitalea sp. BRH_c12]